VINNNLGHIFHRLATVHPWRTNGRTERRTTTHVTSSTIT